MPGPPPPPPPRLLLAAALLLTLWLQGSTVAESAEGFLSEFGKVNNTTSTASTTPALRTLREAPAASDDLQNNAPQSITPSPSLPSSTPSANATSTTKKRKRRPRIRIIKVYKKVWRNPKSKNTSLDTNSGNEVKPSNTILSGNQTSSTDFAVLPVKPAFGANGNGESISQLPHTPSRITDSSEDDKSRDENENQRKGEQRQLPVPPINSEKVQEKSHFGHEPFQRTIRPPLRTEQKIPALPSQIQGNEAVETMKPMVTMINEEDPKPRTLIDFELATQEKNVEEHTVISRVSKPTFQIDEHTESDLAARFLDVFSGYQRGYTPEIDSSIHDDPTTQTDTPASAEDAEYESIPTDTAHQRYSVNNNSSGKHPNAGSYEFSTNPSMKGSTSETITESDNTTEPRSKDTVNDLIENRILPIITDKEGVRKHHANSMNEKEALTEDNSPTEPHNLDSTSVVTSLHSAYVAIPKVSINKQDSPSNPLYVNEHSSTIYPKPSPNVLLEENISLDNRSFSDSDLTTYLSSEENENGLPSISDSKTNRNEHNSAYYKDKNSAENEEFQREMPNENTPIQDNSAKNEFSLNSSEILPAISSENEFLSKDALTQSNFLNNPFSIDDNSSSIISETSTSLSMKESNSSETKRLIYSDNTTYHDNVSSEEDDIDITEMSFVPPKMENLESSVTKTKNQPENYGHQRGMPEVTTPLHEINSIRNSHWLPSSRNKSENTSGERGSILEGTFSTGLSHPDAHFIDKLPSPVTSSEDSKRSPNRKHAKIESVSDLNSDISLHAFKNREFSSLSDGKPNGNEEDRNVPSSKTYSETVSTDISKTSINFPEESTEPIYSSYVVTQQPSEQTEQRDKNFPQAREFYRSSETLTPETSSEKPGVEFDKDEIKDYNTPDTKVKVMELMLQKCLTPNNTPQSPTVKQSNRIHTIRKHLPKVRKIVRDEVGRMLSSMAPFNKNFYRNVLRAFSLNNLREKYKQTNHENNKRPPLNYFAKKKPERTDSLPHPPSINLSSSRPLPAPATLHSPRKKMPESNDFTRIWPLEHHSSRLKPSEGSKPIYKVTSSYYNQPIQSSAKKSGSLSAQHKTGRSKTDGMKFHSLASLTKQLPFKIPPLYLNPPSAIPLSLPALDFVEDGVPDSDYEVLIEKIESRPHNIDQDDDDDDDDRDYMSLQNLNGRRIERFWSLSLATTTRPQRKGQIGMRTYLGQSQVRSASTFTKKCSMKTVLSPICVCDPACTYDRIFGHMPSHVPAPILKHFPAPLNKHLPVPSPTPIPIRFPASVLDPKSALDTGPIQDSFPTPILDSVLPPAAALGLVSFPAQVPGRIPILAPTLLYSVLARVAATVPASFSVPNLGPLPAPTRDPNVASALDSVPSSLLVPALGPLPAPIIDSILAPVPAPILAPLPASILDSILEPPFAPLSGPFSDGILAPALGPLPSPILAPVPFVPLLVSFFHYNVVPRPEPIPVSIRTVVPAPALVPNSVSAPDDLAFSKEMHRGLWTDEGRPLHFSYQGETSPNQLNTPYSDPTPAPYSSWSSSTPQPPPPPPSPSPPPQPSSPPPPPLSLLSPPSSPMPQSAPHLPLSFSPPMPLRWPRSPSLLPPLPQAKRQQVAVNLCAQSFRSWYARMYPPPTPRHSLTLRYS